MEMIFFEADNRELERFLGGLRRALSAHHRFILDVVFRLQFPEVEGRLEACFGEDSIEVERWLSKKHPPEVSGKTIFRKLIVQHRQLVEYAQNFIEKARSEALEPADLSIFLRAAQRFYDLAEKFRTSITTSMIDIDELTGLPNRKAMERDLEAEKERACRGEYHFVVAIADADHFKRVNDQFGHGFGDRVLEELADRLSEGVRPYDRVYRYGGEEFLILLSDTSLSEARDVLDRLRTKVGRDMINDGDHSICVTISIGAASSRNTSVQAIMKAADEALYSAKSSGRNCVKTAT